MNKGHTFKHFSNNKDKAIGEVGQKQVKWEFWAVGTWDFSIQLFTLVCIFGNSHNRDKDHLKQNAGLLMVRFLGKLSFFTSV